MTTLAVGLCSLAIAPACAQAQFELGLEDSALQQPATSAAARTAYGVMRAIAGSTVRVKVAWSEVAPGGATKPAGFQASDPADPRYDWSAIDASVRSATQNHAQVILTLYDAPKWAQNPGQPSNQPNLRPGAWDPKPAEFAAFASAAAVRYSGAYPDPLTSGSTLPRVRLWEIWNEANLPYYLGAPNLVGEYRDLLNAGYTAIKAVHPDDVVAIGGLSPVAFLPHSVSPLKFAAELMCLQRVGTAFHATKSCPQRARFDVFAIHPYSIAATPTKPAYRYDDVLVADMAKVDHLLRAADRLHTVAPSIHHGLWVTEWSWFTNPPDNVIGDSDSTAARYVAYSMYEMWRSGVSLLIWQTIRDYPYANPLGGGLYTSSGRPKLMLTAFEFPVIASVSHGRGFVWGRAPVSNSVVVDVERAVGGHWQQVATAHTASDGVFTVRIRSRTNGRFRARVVGGSVSPAYDSTPIPPKRTHLFNFG